MEARIQKWGNRIQSNILKSLNSIKNPYYF